MKRALFVALPLAVVLSGCALISDPMPMGNDVYTLHATGGTYSSQAGLKSDLWKEATEFCAKQGKTAILVDQTGQSGKVSFNAPTNNVVGSGFGAGFASSFGSISSVSYPEADIVFRCVSPSAIVEQPEAKSKSWVFAYMDKQVGAQAIDINSIRTHGDIKSINTSVAMMNPGDVRAVYVDTMQVNCLTGEYRNTNPQLYVNGHKVDAPKSLTEYLCSWNKPSGHKAPAHILIQTVCKGPTQEQRQNSIPDDDPVHLGYSVLDYLQNQK